MQHLKITCKEKKSKILDENHHNKKSNEEKCKKVTYIIQEKSQLEFSYQNKTH